MKLGLNAPNVVIQDLLAKTFGIAAYVPVTVGQMCSLCGPFPRETCSCCGGEPYYLPVVRSNLIPEGELWMVDMSKITEEMMTSAIDKAFRRELDL